LNTQDPSRETATGLVVSGFARPVQQVVQTTGTVLNNQNLNQYNSSSVYLPAKLHRAQPVLNPPRLKENAMKDLQDVSTSSIQPLVHSHLLRRLVRSLWQGLERARTRRLLAQLGQRDLADLGLSHADRLNELEKPFWR